MKLKPFGYGKNVTTAGTRERLTTAEINTPMVIIQAKSANTGLIYVGNDQVSSTNCMISLAARGTVTLSAADFGGADAVWDLTKIWVDCSVSGEGIYWGYAERIAGE